MIKRKSSTLHTQKRKKYNTSSLNVSSRNSQTLHSNNNNNNYLSKFIKSKQKKLNYDKNSFSGNKYNIVSINSKFATQKGKKKYKTFLSKVHTLRRMKRPPPKDEDKIAQYIDDNRRDLVNYKVIKGDVIDKYFFNNDKAKCVCENIYKLTSKETEDKCLCSNIKNYNSQVISGTSIHSLKCSNVQTILKVLELDTYYMKMRGETKNYMFIELDGFTLQTIINTYVYKILPHNSINIINSGICKAKNYKYKNVELLKNNNKPKLKNKPKSKSIIKSIIKSNIKSKNVNNKKIKGGIHGYHLIDEPDLTTGEEFLLKLLNGNYDKEFKIINEDIRYMFVVNFLLQSTLIIGHLQSSFIEFCHGDYKPNNVFIKKTSTNQPHYFNFNIFGKTMKIKNMGFAVLIDNFGKSSITINSEINKLSNNKYRLIPPILLKPLLDKYVNELIQQYGDLDPDIYEGDIKINKLFISNFIPLGKDPTIDILRSAGIKLYRDFDLYTFMVKLLDDINVRNYVKKHKIDTTILSFMSPKFKNYIFNRLPQTHTKSLSETAYVIIDVLDKIKEPMNRIFHEDYYKLLKLLNYKLFKI